MIKDVDALVNKLVEHKLTFEQFFLCFIHYLDDQKTGAKPIKSTLVGKYPIANIYRYASAVGPFTVDSVNDLAERGYLETSYKSGDKIAPDEMRVTDKFVEAFIGVKSNNFEEFWEEYPAFTDNFDDSRKGKIPLKACGKDEARKIFLDKVGSEEDFNKIMHGLRVAKSKDEVKMRIDNWLNAEYWTAYQDDEIDEFKSSTNRTIV